MNDYNNNKNAPLETGSYSISRYQRRAVTAAASQKPLMKTLTFWNSQMFLLLLLPMNFRRQSSSSFCFLFFVFCILHLTFSYVLLVKRPCSCTHNVISCF